MVLDLHVDLIKGGVEKYGLINPIFKPGPIEPRYSEYLVFEGISVDEFTGKQYYLDAHVALSPCLSECDRVLQEVWLRVNRFHYSWVPVEGRIYCRYSERLPIAVPAIFERNILPS